MRCQPEAGDGPQREVRLCDTWWQSIACNERWTILWRDWRAALNKLELRLTLILAEAAHHCNCLYLPEHRVIYINVTDLRRHRFDCTSILLPSHSNFHEMPLALCSKVSTSLKELLHVLFMRPVIRTVVPACSQQ